ncbi:MAG: creatininase family protein [Deltaproteobacteria bacterium]|nr:creatininase family protein [Deltaproteobacteria bacterium]
MKEIWLERMTYEEAEGYAKAGAVVMLPLSPLEAHGPHLPLGVDFFGAGTLAEQSATLLNRKAVKTVIAPVLPYALADVAMPFAGTVTLRAQTLKAVVSDIAQSFNAHGFKGLVIVCQHLERANLKTLQETASELTEAGMPTIVANPFFTHAETMNAMMKGEFPDLDLHAGEWETAFCLWLYPKLVKMEVLETLPPNWVNLREKLYEQGCRDFVEAGGEKCYFGDPSQGNPELGKKIYEGLAEVLAEEVIEWVQNSP